MQFDIEKSDLVSFLALARKLPKKKNGKRFNVSTIHRWRQPGLKNGICLEAVKIGGAWYTTLAAYHRFQSKLSASSAENGQSTSRTGVDKRRAELDKGGW